MPPRVNVHIEWKIGMSCEGRYLAQKHGLFLAKKWYPGTIASLPDAEGRCDVMYADGDMEPLVPPEYLRLPANAPPPSTTPVTAGEKRARPAEEEAEAEVEADTAAAAPPSPPKLSLGKRKVKSTTVMVDGHAVKRQNMYTMEEGEGSVWDRELSGETDEAFAYHERPAPKAAPKPKAKPAARAVSDEERERLERNSVMRQAREATATPRRQFLEPYRPLLERFGATLGPPPRDGAAAGAPFAEDASLSQPAQITVPMRDYQLRGLRWLSAMHAHGVNAILADEMGLGKTLQTIAFLAHLKFDKGIGGPHLVICPLSVLSSWMTELKRFCPSLNAIKLHSSDPEERKRLVGALNAGTHDFDVVVTTYEMAKSPNVHNQLAARSWWRYLVVDEGHVLKNESSLISQAVRRFHFAHALLLTGTPLQNNLHELWALLHFLYPDVFASSDAFDSAFEMKSAGTSVVDNAQLAAASKLLRPFMLRRTMVEVETLPPKLETSIRCPLSEMQVRHVPLEWPPMAALMAAPMASLMASLLASLMTSLMTSLL